MDESPELLTLTQAAQYLGVSRQAAHRLTQLGIGKRYGSVWMFTRTELDAWRDKPRPHGGRRPKARAGMSRWAIPA